MTFLILLVQKVGQFFKKLFETFLQTNLATFDVLKKCWAEKLWKFFKWIEIFNFNQFFLNFWLESGIWLGLVWESWNLFEMGIKFFRLKVFIELEVWATSENQSGSGEWTSWEEIGSWDVRNKLRLDPERKKPFEESFASIESTFSPSVPSQITGPNLTKPQKSRKITRKCLHGSRD